MKTIDQILAELDRVPNDAECDQIANLFSATCGRLVGVENWIAVKVLTLLAGNIVRTFEADTELNTANGRRLLLAHIYDRSADAIDILNDADWLEQFFPKGHPDERHN